MKNIFLLTLISFALSTSAKFRAPHIPAENHRACIDKVCNTLRSYQCDSRDEILRISDACTRQLDLRCIDLSKSRLSTYEYNDPQEMLALVKSCQYVDSRTLSMMSSELARYEIDDLDEVTRFNDGAYLVQPKCYRSAVKYLRSYQRDDMNEVREIAQMCHGTFKRKCYEDICSSSYKCDDVSEVKSALRKCVDGPSPIDRRKL
jgi:hypothetical protein